MSDTPRLKIVPEPQQTAFACSRGATLTEVREALTKYAADNFVVDLPGSLVLNTLRLHIVSVLRMVSCVGNKIDAEKLVKGWLEETAAQLKTANPGFARQENYQGLCEILRDPEERAKLLGEGELWWDEMTLEARWNSKTIKEADMSAIKEAFVRVYNFNFKTSEIIEAVNQVSAEQDTSIHPVRHYFENLKWDGVPRLDGLCKTLLRQDDAPEITRKMLRRTFVAGAARALHPGCQVDTVTILAQVKQGTNKTSLWRVMAGKDRVTGRHWHSDTYGPLDDNDTLLIMHGCLLYEMGELEQINRASSRGQVRSFITSRRDTIRPSYARRAHAYDRSFLLVGTTNRPDSVEDPAGERRFWIIQLTQKIDLAYARKWRDQIWAESVAIVRAGWDAESGETGCCPDCTEEGRCAAHRWYLADDEQEVMLAQQHENFAATDNVYGLVGTFLAGSDDDLPVDKTGVKANTGPQIRGNANYVTVTQVTTGIVGPDATKHTKAMQMRVAEALTLHGWVKCRKTVIAGCQVYPWCRAEKVDADGSRFRRS